MVNILIKQPKRVRLDNYECYGVTRFLSPSKYVVYVGKNKNREPGQYAITLLHELLHVWVDLIKRNGFPIDLRKEHPYIYAVEKAVMSLTMRMLKEPK